MLRIWGHRCAFATRDSNVYRFLGRSIYLTSYLQDTTEIVDATRSSELRVGVLGLGAIGTIFFTRLGLLATNSKAKKELPTLTVDALVKPEQFGNWEEETLEFRVDLSKGVAAVLDAPNVRVRTLDCVGVDSYDDKLDVLLVAVKAYDSVTVIRELKEKNKHLLKDDALCILLQNGLGEVPEVEGNGLSGVEDRWQFANAVTFVGGRVVEFGSVVASGLDAGMTYLAPFGGSEEEMQLQKERDVKVEMLAQIFLAAGLRCKVLEISEMQAMLWRKLIVNAAINPLASLLDAPNKVNVRLSPSWHVLVIPLTSLSVASSEGSRHCVNMVVQESLAVAKSEQIPLSFSQNELVEDILDVARNTGTNVCSMLADLRRGSKTEIDAITGRIVAGGKRHGIPTPTNELLLSLIKALEEDGTRRIEYT
ncbi:NAD(P)-binding domain [Phytophthora cactorum]|nr:NAD(P)-binding domain [Phytophthora cactorum]KAF1783936.1 NAD(P)-binding domain [Phytophthora cactorum]